MDEPNKPNTMPNHANNKSLDALREEIVEKLTHTKVSSLKFAPKAIVLDAQVHPAKAIKTLLKYKIRAAPVIQNDEFLGVLDLRDTVKYALESYQLYKQESSLSPVHEAKENEHALTEDHLLSHEHLHKVSLASLCQHRPFKFVRQTDSLMDVAQLFAAGCHVVGAVRIEQDTSKTLVGIITQGYFYREVCKQWPLNDSCDLQPLMKLKYVTSPVQSIHRLVKASDAFAHMIGKDLSGLAVLDDKGCIIHNTSATDIKLWLLSASMLEEPIEQFLISVRNLSLIERYPVAMCQVTDSFKRAIQMMVATKYHRLWIVDEDRRPVGVLAITDVFQFLCEMKEQ